MGWANCGEDSKGRPIGYAHSATCDIDGCEASIDRGLSYACGGMHGEDVYSCEGYACDQHLTTVETPEGECLSICSSCYYFLEKEGLVNEEGEIVEPEEV